jgi:hypothetical protein
MHDISIGKRRGKGMLMKRHLVLLGLVAALTVAARAEQTASPASSTKSTNAAPATAAPAKSALTSAAGRGGLQVDQMQAVRKRRALVQDEKPNEILTERVGFNGIAVQLVKTDNPIQMVNPVAPARYGTAEDNTLRNPIDGKILGLNIFSIRF